MMVLLEHRGGVDDITYLYVTDIEELEWCIDWLISQKIAMKKKGKTNTTTFRFNGEER